MSDGFYYYEPAKGHGLPHDPFYGIVAPRPIGWISTRSAAGISNLAPYSFFNGVSSRPPVIAFSSDGRKDTLVNIEETCEFVWNLSTRAQAEEMNLSSAASPFGVSEFTFSGLEETPSRLVKAPRVAGSPVSFECRLADMLRLRDSKGDHINNWLITGEVVAVHIAEWLLKDGIYDTAAAAPIMRGGGRDSYFEIKPEDWFAMARPGYLVK